MLGALLQFSEGKPYGRNRKLYWLAVHTAFIIQQILLILTRFPNGVTTITSTFLESQGLTDISVDKMTLEDRAEIGQIPICKN